MRRRRKHSSGSSNGRSSTNLARWTRLNVSSTPSLGRASASMRRSRWTQPQEPDVSLDIHRSARAIAAVQAPDGSIPHWPGHHADPWNHIEAAMGLDVAGMHAEAERAYGWLVTRQRSDGAWAAAYMGDVVTEP